MTASDDSTSRTPAETSLGSLSQNRMSILVIAAVALAVRLAVVISWPHQLEVDADGYLQQARALANGDGFINKQLDEPSAFRPPLYPIVLSVLLWLRVPYWGIGVFHALLGVATVVMTWGIARRLGLSHWRAFFAAAVVSFDPILVGYTVQAMTETLFTLLLTMVLFFWTTLHTSDPCRFDAVTSHKIMGRRQWITGFLLGLTGLCRPTVWAFAMLVLVVWVWRQRRNLVSAAKWQFNNWRLVDWPVVNWRLVVGAFVIVAPWAVRNALMLGRPIVTTTHGGYTLLLGNNPVFYREVLDAPWGTTWSRASLSHWQNDMEIQLSQAGIEGECARDVWLRNRALANISNDPVSFFRACGLRIVRFWRVVPHDGSRVVRIGSCVFYVSVLLAFMTQLIQVLYRRIQLSPAVQLMLLAILSFTAVHAVYWSNMRMRGPLIPLIAILIAGSLVREGDAASV